MDYFDIFTPREKILLLQGLSVDSGLHRPDDLWRSYKVQVTGFQMTIPPVSSNNFTLRYTKLRMTLSGRMVRKISPLPMPLFIDQLNNTIFVRAPFHDCKQLKLKTFYTEKQHKYHISNSCQDEVNAFNNSLIVNTFILEPKHLRLLGIITKVCSIYNGT